MRWPPKRRRQRRRRSGFPSLPILLVAGVAFAFLKLSPGLTGAVPDFAGEEVRDRVSGQFVLCSSRSPLDNCVVDGDTIRLGGKRIRLADIDTPEVHEPSCAWEAEHGRRATRRLLTLINEGPIDVVNAGSRDEDRYGRKLRIVERDGRSLGAILPLEGLARPWDGARSSWCG